MFSPVDFVVFGAFLLLSLGVGLYHGIVPSIRLSPTGEPRSKTGDFLDGGRRLPVLPVCLSLLTTFVSGLNILGVPAEIYTRGSSMVLFILFGCLAFPMISAFFIPIFFKLKVSSCVHKFS
jgi:sodium-coupled monocarboxylate transporter 8/12